jgi:hypothetical protein
MIQRHRFHDDDPFGDETPEDDLGGSFSELGGRFRFNSTMFELLTDGLMGEDWSRRAGEGSSAHWILGHLCTMRLSLLRTLGVDEPDREWEPLFAVSGGPSPVRGVYPAPRELLSCFRGTARGLAHALDTMSPARAREHWDEGTFDPPVTVEDCVGFFYFDETFHLGQLGLARQQLGKPQVI